MTTGAPVRQQVQVCIGKAGLPAGSLIYVRQGRREERGGPAGSALLGFAKREAKVTVTTDPTGPWF
jgi:hypothetical protein